MSNLKREPTTGPPGTTVILNAVAAPWLSVAHLICKSGGEGVISPVWQGICEALSLLM